jgi:hypothetical protein
MRPTSAPHERAASGAVHVSSLSALVDKYRSAPSHPGATERRADLAWPAPSVSMAGGAAQKGSRPLGDSDTAAPRAGHGGTRERPAGLSVSMRSAGLGGDALGVDSKLSRAQADRLNATLSLSSCQRLAALRRMARSSIPSSREPSPDRCHRCPPAIHARALAHSGSACLCSLSAKGGSSVLIDLVTPCCIPSATVLAMCAFVPMPRAGARGANLTSTST